MVLVPEKHVCHPKILHQVEEHLNRAVQEEISTLDSDINTFEAQKTLSFTNICLIRAKNVYRL